MDVWWPDGFLTVLLCCVCVCVCACLGIEDMNNGWAVCVKMPACVLLDACGWFNLCLCLSVHVCVCFISLFMQLCVCVCQKLNAQV